MDDYRVEYGPGRPGEYVGRWPRRLFDCVIHLGKGPPVVEDAHLAPLGEAFSGLLRGLPSHLALMLDMRSLTPVNKNTLRTLSRRADVVAGGPHTIQMAAFGLTPATFNLAMSGIATLVSNLVEDKKVFPSDNAVRISRYGSSTEHAIGFREAVVEVALSADTDPMTLAEESQYASLDDIPFPKATWLTEWLVAASRIKPLLFPGYMTTMDGDDLLLEPTATTDVQTRWATVNARTP